MAVKHIRCSECGILFEKDTEEELIMCPICGKIMRSEKHKAVREEWGTYTYKGKIYKK